MSLPSIPKQQLKMSTTAETANTLTMAELGQLQWVKRPLSSLSALAGSKEVLSSTSDVSSDDDVPSLWWPSLLFNDYDDFQDFFADEFDKSNIENNEASETKGLILSRMFQNMHQQRTIMVARLLGRSIREYVEIVELHVEDRNGEEKVKNDNPNFLVEPHQATEFVSFTRMPQEVYLPQMEPEAFIVSSNINLTDDDSSISNDATTVIDDDLYMSYMLALDLASTKRMCGPQAPHHTLRSDFREKGRAKLAKLPPFVQKSSETAYASSLFDDDAPVIATEGVETLEKPEQDDSEDESEEDTDSEEETEDKEMFEENINQTMDTNKAVGVGGAYSAVSSEQEKKTQAKVADTVQPETQAEETAHEANVTEEIRDNTSPPTESIATKVSVACDATPADKSPVDDRVNGKEFIGSNGDGVKRGNEGDDNTDMNDASSLSATVISQSSDGPEAADIGTSSSHRSPTIASTNSSPRNETNGGGATKKIDFPETQNKRENTGSKSLATSPAKTPIKSPLRKSNRGGANKFVLPNTSRKEDDSRSQPAANSPATNQMKSPSKKGKGGRAMKVISPNTPIKEGVARTRSMVNSPAISSSNSSPSSPRRTNRRVLPKRNAALPEESSEEDAARTQSLANSPTVSSISSSPRRTNRRIIPKRKTGLPEEPSEKDDAGTKSLENNPETPLVNTCPLKETKRRLSPRKIRKKDGARTLSFNSPSPAPINSPPQKKMIRRNSKNKSDLPKINGKDIERDTSIEDLHQASRMRTRSASPSASISRFDRRLKHPKKAVDSSEKTEAQDSTNSTQGVVDKTYSPTCSPETRAVSIQASPSPQNSFGVGDPGITSDDSFDEVCKKLEYIGWTIDKFDYNYFSPSVGYDDIKKHPRWRLKKYFLGKDDFLVFLQATFAWPEKKTKTPTRKRDWAISNAVTPISSSRPKRTRRSPSFSIESFSIESCLPKEKPKQFDFETTDEEEFYNFPNLMPKLKAVLGWQYLSAKTRNWHYVLPGGRKESQGGEHLVDFLFEESEVIQYCFSQNYYEKRQEMGLDDKD